MTAMEISGALRPCPVCHAPTIWPVPDGWTIELIKEGPATGPVVSVVTVHAEQCDAPDANPQPGTALRVPASVVADITLDPAPQVQAWRTGRGGTVWLGPARARADTWPDDWKLIGYTDAGTMSDDGVTYARAVTGLHDGQTWVKSTVRFDVDGEAAPGQEGRG